MNDQPTLATLTEDQLADLLAEAAAYRNQPALRHCLVPRCLREYDALAGMNGRPPARGSWSSKGWHQVTRGISPGSICPDHVDVVTAHQPSTIDLPNGRYVVHCACGWETSQQVYGGLLRAMWEQHLLQSMGDLPTSPTPTAGVERIPLADHTPETITELYDALDDTEYDRAETREAAQVMFKAWDWHRHALGGAARAVVSVCNMMRTAASHYERDWTTDRHDAYLWAVLIGWDEDTLQEVAAKHRWNEHRIKYAREMRALLAPMTDPQPKEN